MKRLLTGAYPLLDSLLNKAAKYEISILYTRVDRDLRQRPQFTTYSFNYDSLRYFYPASTVKLPAVILSLEKLNALRIKGLDRNTPLKIDSASSRQRRLLLDSTARNGLPSIGHEIHKVLLVSDNLAYNVLYEFLGQQALNETLIHDGFRTARIIQRLEVGDSPETGRISNPFTFYKGKTVLYRQPMLTCKQIFPMKAYGLQKGHGYMKFNKGDSMLVNSPFDFSDKNFLALRDQHEILKRIMFPAAYPHTHFNLTAQDYRFLYVNMSMYPRESMRPVYSENLYPDNYVKYLGFASDATLPLPPGLRIFNKIGQAYGYLIDNAFFVDFDHDTEFFLSAVINVNTSGIYNNDRYAYSSIGYPFMRALGQAIIKYENARTKKVRPDLIRFRCNYSADPNTFLPGKKQ